MKVYIDDDFKCHVTNDGTMTTVESGFFNGKCDTFIEGYRFDPTDEKIEPWKNYDELDSAQREYERELLADAENALAILFGGETV